MKARKELATKKKKIKEQEVQCDQLEEALSQCTSEQIAFFNKIYGSIEKITLTQVPTALRQCRSTMKKNEQVILDKSW